MSHLAELTRKLRSLWPLLDERTRRLTAASEATALGYLRRWRIELWFRHLKTTMKMEHLRCLTPAMVHKELEMYFIAYNLIRCVTAEAALVHEVPVERISFKGAVDTVRQYAIVLAQARTQKQRHELVALMLSDLARDPVPERPGRRQPRAVKRRPKPFALLTKPRHLFKEIPHRGRAGRKTRASKNKGLI
jgi:hypothetical protein